MRFYADHPARAKRVAKLLRKRLVDSGVTASLPSCQNAVAVMYGFAHWSEMAANLGRESASPSDEAAGPTVAELRRTRYIDVLIARFPLDREAAAAIVDKIRPTGAHRSPSADASKDRMRAFDRPGHRRPRGRSER